MIFRLSGNIEDAPHTFPLEDGQQVLGGGRGANIVVPVRGVSRHHALLDVRSDGVWVQDLDSKNGTWINDLRLTPAQESSDDGFVALPVQGILRLGPVELHLEEADEEEAQLGVVLDASSLFDPSRAPTQASTWWTEADDHGALPLRAFEVAVQRLVGLPEPDMQGALEDVAQLLAAPAMAWLSWPELNAEPTVQAAVGEVGEVPPLNAFSRRAEGEYHFRQQDLLAIGMASSEGVLGLVVWGEEASSNAGNTLPAALLRLFVRFGARGTDLPAASVRPHRTSRLRFPESIVRGRSPIMTALYQQMEGLLDGDVPVLLLGETGVGKEHLARALHEGSNRGQRPFVAINCAAIPDSLLEAEMFGVGKGVATGVSARQGRFAEAHGGTLFLDEIGEMPLELQAKLLRALQEGIIHPLGRAPETVNVRVVSATNADLRFRSKQGQFRADLFYRLAGYELQVPALRQRRDDIPQLVGHFLSQHCKEARKTLRGVTVRALQRLVDYDWPGNVRELEHEVRRWVYACPRGQAIDLPFLSPHLQKESEGPGDGPNPDDHTLDTLHLDARLAALERQLIQTALERTGGNKTRAAKLLGISRNGLGHRLKRLGLDA